MKHPGIEVNEKVMFGQPVIKGTRIPVEQILRKLGPGLSVSEILTQHPNLTKGGIHAAEAYAADVISNEDIIFSSETVSQ